MESYGAWLLLFALYPSGTASFPALKPPHQVNGILGGSALLSIAITPPWTASSIEWKFQGKTRGLAQLVAEFGGGKLERPNPRDRFGQRLELVNETALRIKPLVLTDSGIFSARVRLATAEVQEHLFHLAVYEALPALRIVPELVSRTSDECNVTLQCQVLGRGDFIVFWKRGDPSKPLEDGSERHQLSDTGKTLHVSWQLHSSNSSFTCLVSSPAEQKTVSFDLLNICSEEGANACLSWPRVVIVGGLVGLVATVVVVHTLERKDQKLSSLHH